jgi:hypothetical protein
LQQRRERRDWRANRLGFLDQCHRRFGNRCNGRRNNRRSRPGRFLRVTGLLFQHRSLELVQRLGTFSTTSRRRQRVKEPAADCPDTTAGQLRLPVNFKFMHSPL